MQIQSILASFLVAGLLSMTPSCASDESSNSTALVASETPQDGGQSTVQDNESQKNIVQAASASKDHTTLVAAVKAAELVDALSNAGPFTVFAPVNGPALESASTSSAAFTAATSVVWSLLAKA